MDFSGFGPDSDVPEDRRLIDEIGRVTSLQAPHRLADAVLRDSVYRHNGEAQSFRKSEIGREIDRADLRNTTPLYELCPTALVFGMWGSTGLKGGLGAKLRASDDIGDRGCGMCLPLLQRRGAAQESRRSKRSAGRSRAVRVKKYSLTEWEVVKDPKAKGTLSPAEINHSNVPFEGDNVGVTIEYAEQTAVLSLPALRRLRFPKSGKAWTASDDQRNRDRAAQTVLAALALCAAELSAVDMDLRSRCLLWPDEPRRWPMLNTPGEAPKEFTLGAEAAVKLLNDAIVAAEKFGVTWHSETIRLTPSEQLVALVRRSQEQAAVEGGEEGD